MKRRTRAGLSLARAGLPLARAGFTLVELLVVISIIGMLAALLLPAVNAAREAGRKSVCVNNQRQVGLAVFQYETAKNEYPGYVMPQTVLIDPSTSNKIATRPIGWVFSLMQRLERNDIADNYGINAPKIAGAYPPGSSGQGPYAVPNQHLNILVCPSDAQSGDPDPEGLADNANTSYVVNTGLKDDEDGNLALISEKSAPTDPPTTVAVAGAGVPRDWAANGVFQYQFYYAGPDSSGNYLPSGEKPQKVTASSISDGTSTTLILSENSDSGSWTNIKEQNVGFYWQATADANLVPTPLGSIPEEWLPNPLLRINEQTGLSTGGANPIYGRPSSYHPGGVVVTYADAHTSFLNADVDYLVYCLIMTPRGKYSLPAGIKGINGGQQTLFLDGNFFDPTTDGRAKFARSTLSEDQL